MSEPGRFGGGPQNDPSIEELRGAFGGDKAAGTEEEKKEAEEDPADAPAEKPQETTEEQPQENPATTQEKTDEASQLEKENEVIASDIAENNKTIEALRKNASNMQEVYKQLHADETTDEAKKYKAAMDEQIRQEEDQIKALEEKNTENKKELEKNNEKIAELNKGKEQQKEEKTDEPASESKESEPKEFKFDVADKVIYENESGEEENGWVVLNHDPEAKTVVIIKKISTSEYARKTVDQTKVKLAKEKPQKEEAGKEEKEEPRSEAENNEGVSPEDFPQAPTPKDKNEPANETVDPERERAKSEAIKIRAYNEDLLKSDFNIMVEKAREKGLGGKALAFLQRSAKVRMAAGIVLSAIGAFTGGADVALAGRGVLGVIGGILGGAGYGANKREADTMRTVNAKFGDCIKDGIIDKSMVMARLESGQVKLSDIKEMYMKLTEVASAKGREINVELQKQEALAKKSLEEKTSKGFIGSIRNTIGKSPWYIKFALGAALALGAGYVGTAALASFGIAQGSAAAGGFVLRSAVQLGLGVKQKMPNELPKAYEHSDMIHLFASILEQNGGITEQDFKRFDQYRKSARKGRIASAFVGGVIGAAATVGVASLMGHHNHEVNAQHPNQDGAASNSPGPDAQPHAAGGVNPETSPDGATIHLKPDYLTKPENTGINADKHLAEVELRGMMEKTGKQFGNHEQFVAARDHLVNLWHQKHPELFGTNGSFEPNQIHNITHTLNSEDAAGAIEEFAHPIVGETDPTHHSADATHHETASHEQREFPVENKNSFEGQSVELNKGQLDELLNPDKKYLSPELCKRFKDLLAEGKLSEKDFRITSTPDHMLTDIKVNLHDTVPGREFIGHHLMKPFVAENSNPVNFDPTNQTASNHPWEQPAAPSNSGPGPINTPEAQAAAATAHDSQTPAPGTEQVFNAHADGQGHINVTPVGGNYHSETPGDAQQQFDTNHAPQSDPDAQGASQTFTAQTGHDGTIHVTPEHTESTPTHVDTSAHTGPITVDQYIEKANGFMHGDKAEYVSFVDQQIRVARRAQVLVQLRQIVDYSIKRQNIALMPEDMRAVLGGAQDTILKNAPDLLKTLNDAISGLATN